MKVFPRTVSRIAAVQAIFQSLALPKIKADSLLEEFKERFSEHYYLLFDEETPLKIDHAFFEKIVRNVFSLRPVLFTIITDALPQDWTLDQLEKTTHAIFLCALCEIIVFKDMPKQVLFNEYITIAHGFLLEKGHKFINALLERMYEKAREQTTIYHAERAEEQELLSMDSIGTPDCNLALVDKNPEKLIDSI